MSTQAALLMEWQQELADDFEAARAFLRPTQEQIESYPCTHLIPCGCRHRVIFESEEDISAVCECDDAVCDRISLRTSDLIVYALDGGMLAAAIRGAFRFNELENVGFEELRSRVVGSWGVRRSPVFFNVPISESGLQKEIDRLCAAVSNPFVLLTPTARFCTPMVQRALQRQGCAQMSLEGVVSLTAPGVLGLIPAAKATVDVFFGDFGKQVGRGKPLELAIARVEEKLKAIAKELALPKAEAVSPEAAVGAFAIVQKLDDGHRLKKATLMKVFRLYCIEGMSSRQIASQCGCSKTMVMKRLKFLEEKLGMPPAKLRAYSTQFERMEDELTDSRARRIDRWKLAHEGEPEDENG
ncbi:MAG TPA: sigma factor-like helix-turn-helix DNA-binding protein [Verrucomicrobiae bacterium]